jgi:hypothetical protein
MLTLFEVDRDCDGVPSDVFPTGLVRFIRKVDGGLGDRVVMDGAFGRDSRTSFAASAVERRVSKAGCRLAPTAILRSCHSSSLDGE